MLWYGVRRIAYGSLVLVTAVGMMFWFIYVVPVIPQASSWAHGPTSAPYRAARRDGFGQAYSVAIRAFRRTSLVGTW